MNIVDGYIAEFNWIAQKGAQLTQFPDFWEFVWEETTEDITPNDLYLLWPVWVAKNTTLRSRIKAWAQRWPL